jgi:hypothetical protein
MSDNETSNHPELKILTEKIISFERRLKLIETKIGISDSENLKQPEVQKQDIVPDPIVIQDHHGESFLESRIGFDFLLFQHFIIPGIFQDQGLAGHFNSSCFHHYGILSWAD